MAEQKRIAAIHDISGIGKCSLTAAIPVISAAGIETAVMPTAVLSTHTGDISGFTYRDLTSDLVEFYTHCGFDFFARISCHHFIEIVTEGCNIAFTLIRVHIITDGNITNIF